MSITTRPAVLAAGIASTAAILSAAAAEKPSGLAAVIAALEITNLRGAVPALLSSLLIEAEAIEEDEDGRWSVVAAEARA